jgi:hypothetical protein
MQIMNTQGTLKRPVTLDSLLGKKRAVKEKSNKNREELFGELLKKFN